MGSELSTYGELDVFTFQNRTQHRMSIFAIGLALRLYLQPNRFPCSESIKSSITVTASDSHPVKFLHFRQCFNPLN